MKTIAQKTTTLLLVAALFALGTGCSKEKQIERHMEKVKDWTISRIDYQRVQIGSGLVAKVGSETNAGKMTFNKDGSGSYDYMLDGLHRTGTFKWTVTANDVSFNYVAASTTDVQAVSYNILSESKSAMDLQGSEVVIGTSGIFTLNATFHLVK